MVSVSEVSVSDQFKRHGRKPKLTPEKLLEAIREYASTEPSLLGEKLGVNRSTIWRYMQRIPKEEIETTLREVAELELKPVHRDFKIFLQIPEVADYNKKLKAKRSRKYRLRMLHGLHRACVFLRKHPVKLTVGDVAQLLRDVQLDQKRPVSEKPKTPFKSLGELQKAFRSWFLRRGISAQYLTENGVEADSSSPDKERAHTRLTPEQRARFMHVLEEKVRDYPEEQKLQWLILPKYLYYTGTRIAGTLKSRIEKLEKPKGPLWYHNVKDKKALKWRKRITGELKDLINTLLELRGKPQKYSPMRS